MVYDLHDPIEGTLSDICDKPECYNKEKEHINLGNKQAISFKDRDIVVFE